MYCEDFEAPFLERTSEFYRAEVGWLWAGRALVGDWMDLSRNECCLVGGEPGLQAGTQAGRQEPEAAKAPSVNPRSLAPYPPTPLAVLPSPQAAEYISSCDCPAYLAHAERRLAEEVDRVGAYLDASTEAKVVKVRVCVCM